MSNNNNSSWWLKTLFWIIIPLADDKLNILLYQSYITINVLETLVLTLFQVYFGESNFKCQHSFSIFMHLRKLVFTSMVILWSRNSINYFIHKF